MKKYIPYFPAILMLFCMLIFPNETIFASRSAVALCLDIIIPTLLPFFICSALLIYSGLCRTLSRIFAPIMKPLFNVSGCGAAALCLGTLSGYPQGAITACELYTAGYLSKTEAERLLAFCNSSGPLFVLGAVGIATYSSREIGLILYLSHLAAAFTVGFIFRFYKKGSHTAPTYSLNQTQLPFSQIFSRAVTESMSTILIISGAVILFGVLSGLISHFLPENCTFSALIYGALELSGGVRAVSETALPTISKLVISAFFVGFAGLCVHLQVAAIVSKTNLSLLPYLFGKLLHGILSALFTLFALRLFPQSIATFSPAPAGGGAFFGSLYLSASSAIVMLPAPIMLLSSALKRIYSRKKT